MERFSSYNFGGVFKIALPYRCNDGEIVFHHVCRLDGILVKVEIVRIVARFLIQVDFYKT